MRKFLLVALATVVLGCGTSQKISDSDRRDAGLVLKDLEYATKAVDFEQSNAQKPSDHKGSEVVMVPVFVKKADETRTKYKTSPIEPQVSKLCLALTAYWELPDGKGDKAKAAAAEVDKAKAELQAVAEGK